MTQKRLFGLVLVGVWVCGGCLAKIPKSKAADSMARPRDTSSCAQMRDNMEHTLYETFKGSLPRPMLKEVLPILIEPLLPTECHTQGSDSPKWVSPTAASPSPLSRPKRFIPGFFMPPMTKVKDPGDRPPPGMTRNPFKDPGDRPGGILSLFGFPVPPKIKDPGDHPPTPPPEPTGEPAPMSPFASMMRMMRMINFSRQMARAFSPPPSPTPASNKPTNGPYFGDVFPVGR